jgi:hypothetical protein
MVSNASEKDDIQTAVVKIRDFVKQVAGFVPTETEIADALQRYFVLKEISDHIVMVRSHQEPEVDR